MERVPSSPAAPFFVVGDPATQAAHVRLRAAYRASLAPRSAASRTIRVAALGLLGAAVGIGGAVVGVSLVQANDSAGLYAILDNTRSPRSAPRPQSQPIYASHSSYAPARPVPFQPLAGLNGRGMVAFPDFNLNPFNPTGPDRAAKARSRKAKLAEQPGFDNTFNTVSGASNAPRSICVRLCDGYQHPLAPIRDSGDLRGHEALCTAMFPNVPTRVFRVAAGADTIDDAVGPDGKTYRQLPMAYAYQTSIDPACARPRTGAQTVSLFKDFTLRAGDTVMINGRPRVFNGATSYPYTAANFRDFRSSTALNAATRRQVDEVVGVSRQERLQREVRQMSRVREANAVDSSRAIDLVRGGVAIEGMAPATTMRAGSQVRIIEMRQR
jgi:hypothetical protein